MDQLSLTEIIAGVIITFVVALIVHFYKNAFLPYLSSSVYKSFPLTGIWIVDHIGDPVDGEELDLEWVTTLNLQQRGTTILGKAGLKCIDGPDGHKNKELLFDVRGKINSHILNLALYDTKNGKRQSSSFMLQMQGNGEQFQGYRLFFGYKKNTVRAIECLLKQADGIAQCGIT